MAIANLVRAAREATELARQLRAANVDDAAGTRLFAKLHAWNTTRFLSGRMSDNTKAEIDDSLLTGHADLLIGRLAHVGQVTAGNAVAVAEMLEELAEVLEPAASGASHRTEASPDAADSRPRFGKWIAEGTHLGKGGQGEVVQVRSAASGERGALKRMTGRRAGTDKAHARFLREVAAFQLVKHPFVLRILDSGEQPEPFLVTELAPFGSLHDHLDAFRGDAWRCLRIARDLAMGLGEAHARGVVHRDVKPKNILLRSMDHPLLGDFGIAHFEDRETLTSVNSHPGTFLYSPAEFEMEGDPTPAFDVFSLGGTLHTILTKAPPRPYRLLESLPPVGEGERGERLAPIDALLARMTARSPGKRISSMARVVDAIDEVLRELFGQSAAPGRCSACGDGRVKELGKLVEASGTELNVYPKGAHQASAYGLASLQPVLQICDRCGALSMRSDRPVGSPLRR